MSAADGLLAELRSLGAVLSMDDAGRLAFDSSAGVMTNELRGRLRENRDELLKSLQTTSAKKQNVSPESEEMLDGVRCPYCDHRFYADDPAGCRCGRLCWVKIPNGGICRGDVVGMAL